MSETSPMSPESPDQSSPDIQSAGTDRIRIRNWPDAKDPIHDDTKLIRYMKLETFLLMLNSRVFIPTLECLRAIDPLESRIPQRFHKSKYPEAMKRIVLPHQDWLDQISSRKKVPTEDGDSVIERVKFLTQAWLDELGKRRCVWCWNRSVDELHAMWKLYGQRGVAIRSTVGEIRRALVRTEAEGFVSPVKYVYEGVPRTPEQQDGFYWMKVPKYLNQPYLFKDAGFRFEEEVRFVLRINPAVTGRSNGALLDIAATDMVGPQSFDVSKELPKSERGLIRLIGCDFLMNRLTLPSFAISSSGLFGLAPSKPFTLESDLPTAFFQTWTDEARN
jgi:hypothetical protein